MAHSSGKKARVLRAAPLGIGALSLACVLWQAATLQSAYSQLDVGLVSVYDAQACHQLLSAERWLLVATVALSLCIIPLTLVLAFASREGRRAGLAGATMAIFAGFASCGGRACMTVDYALEDTLQPSERERCLSLGALDERCSQNDLHACNELADHARVASLGVPGLESLWLSALERGCSLGDEQLCAEHDEAASRRAR